MHTLFSLLTAPSLDSLDAWTRTLTGWGITLGKRILLAAIIYVVGRFLIKLVCKGVERLLSKPKVDASVRSFVRSLVNITLTVLLLISIIDVLGISTTSFAALLASVGVAVGMALSGNLQNFAGGLVILLFKPYRVGDWVEAQTYSGTVREIQIFHTIIETIDLRRVYVPNSLMSTAVVVNHTAGELRREEWVVSLVYGNNLDHAVSLLRDLMLRDDRVLKGEGQAPEAKVKELAGSSVDIVMRCYVATKDYWPVHHDMLAQIYKAVDADPALDFAFPTQTVHVENRS